MLQFILQNILKSSVDGAELLIFGKTQKLNSCKRVILMKKITNYFIENDLCMSLKACENFAEQIPKYFKGETKVKKIYYNMKL